MSTTTDLTKKDHMVHRRGFMLARAAVEQTHSWGDFLHQLARLLQEPEYAIWRATKFDTATGEPTELSLKMRGEAAPRVWTWRPNDDHNIKVPSHAKKQLLKWFNQLVERNTGPVLWHDDGDVNRRSTEMLLMSLDHESTAYNANEAPGSVTVLKFHVLVNKETFYLSSAV